MSYGIIPELVLTGGQTLEMTFDFSSLSDNFTYGNHYRIAVYADCTPCPARYMCDMTQSPTACSSPSTAEQVAYGATCDVCCLCQPKWMPHWLHTNDEVFPRYDNKHGLVSLTLTAIRPTNLTIALELLHGLYYPEFDAAMKAATETVKGIAEATLFEPFRARYEQSDAIGDRSRTIYTFFSIIKEDDFADLALPFNLPDVGRALVVPAPAPTYTRAFENQVLMNRPADARIGQPAFWDQVIDRSRGLYVPSTTPTMTPSPSVTAGLPSGSLRRLQQSQRKESSSRNSGGAPSATLGESSTSTGDGNGVPPLPLHRLVNALSRGGAALSKAIHRAIFNVRDSDSSAMPNTQGRRLQTLAYTGPETSSLPLYIPGTNASQLAKKASARYIEVNTGKTGFGGAPCIEREAHACTSATDTRGYYNFYDTWGPPLTCAPKNSTLAGKRAASGVMSVTFFGCNTTDCSNTAPDVTPPGGCEVYVFSLPLTGACTPAGATAAARRLKLKWDVPRFRPSPRDPSASDATDLEPRLFFKGVPGSSPNTATISTYLSSTCSGSPVNTNVNLPLSDLPPTSKTGCQAARGWGGSAYASRVEPASDGWYVGCAASFSSSGQLIPPNPYLLPANYLDTHKELGKNKGWKLPGESESDFARREELGLVCVDFDDSPTDCANRIARIRQWAFVTHRNFREEPEADIVIDPLSWVQRQPTWWKSFDPDGRRGMSFLALPYLPFFSNCDGYDSFMDISKLTEAHPDCTSVPYRDTVYVDPYPWNYKNLFPQGDSCQDSHWVPNPSASPPDVVRPGVPLYCHYEESIYESSQTTFWYQTYPGTVLWRMTQEPIDHTQFEGDGAFSPKGSASGNSFWGGTSELATIVASPNIVSVTVVAPESGVIWQPSFVPRTVNLTLSYYQVTRGYKRLMQGLVTLGDFCSTDLAPDKLAIYAAMGVKACASEDLDYTLRFTWQPLWWLDLLDLFAFPPPVYILIYVIIGLAIIFIGFIIWLVHRLCSRLHTKPEFRFSSMWRVVTPAPVVGVLLGTGPAFLAILFPMAWFIMFASKNPVSSPNVLLFEGFSGDWRGPEPLDLASVTKYRIGRFAICVLLASFYGLHSVAQLFVTPLSIEKLARDDSALDGAAEREDENGDEDDENDESGGMGVDLAAAESKLAAAHAHSSAPPVGGALGVQGNKPAAPGSEHDSAAMLGLGSGPKPATEEADIEGLWTPWRWKVANVFMVSALQVIMMIILINFSTSLYFGQYANFLIPLIRIGQLGYESLCRLALRDVLLSTPLVVALNVVQVQMVQGANTFISYIVCYLIILSSSIICRLYIEPFAKRLYALLPRMRMTWLRWLRNFSRVKLTREQRLALLQQEKQVDAWIEQDTEGMEPVLESFALYSAETAAMLMQPFFQLVVYLTDAAQFPTTTSQFQLTHLPAAYGININDLIYYTMFSVVIVPFIFAMDMFVLNTLEIVHGWRVYDYVSYQRYRYTLRATRWHLASNAVDLSITPRLQSLDAMCFSSQYYFMLALHAWSMMLAAVAIIVLLQWQYNPFSDYMFIVLLPATWLACNGIWSLCVWLGNRCGLWKRKTLDGTVEDEVGVRLAVGEGTAADIAAERMEIAALNSERFRMRFLERARPWVISQLPNMLTPRTLKMRGSDGRPHVEYIRDVYEGLIKMSELAKLAVGGDGRVGGREEDFEAEAEAAQLELFNSRGKVGGVNKRVLLQWLGDARKRMTYREAVTGIVEHGRRPTCDLCHKHEVDVGLLRPDFATAGRYDPDAFDRVISEYEVARRRAGVPSAAPFDKEAWKAYFRTNAQLFMRCETCVSKTAELARTVGQEKQFGIEARETRAAARKVALTALGLDEDDDVYEPLHVDRKSVEGRALSKWLGAARRRIGGAFPKPSAREEMAKYAKLAEETRERRKAKLEAELAKRAAPTRIVLSDAYSGPLDVDPASAAIALKWLSRTRSIKGIRSRNEAVALRARLDSTLHACAPAHDWFLTSELRIRGAVLVGEGRDVLAQLVHIDGEFERAVHDDTVELDEFVSARNTELKLALVALDDRTKEVDVVYTAEEVEAMRIRQRRLENLEVSYAGMPDTSAAASQERRRIETIKGEIAKIKADAASTQTERLRAVRNDMEARITRLRTRIAEAVQASARRVSTLRFATNERCEALESPYRTKALAWIEGADKRLAALPAAEAAATAARARGGRSPRAGSPSPRGGDSPRGVSPVASPAATTGGGFLSGLFGATSPRTPAAVTPRTPIAETPRTPAAETPRTLRAASGGESGSETPSAGAGGSPRRTKRVSIVLPSPEP